MNRFKIPEEIDRLKKKIKESILTIKDIIYIQYIDERITEIVLFAENKWSNKKVKHQLSPSFGRVYSLVAY